MTTQEFNLRPGPDPETPPFTVDAAGNIVCRIHRDASVMDANDVCGECQDDAHEQEIWGRP